ncbi:hypothetical protein AR438_15025 [Chryseobacterium aquaticum]|uniref:Uncharacterized protein n=1 Tax=Chryseobacterium aquaticum TaxID=452084 RepID=A0A0Q3P3B8_9FLAO|nr:hypothetical protein AR438_15025 [Chryseobacterium aquaticum]
MELSNLIEIQKIEFLVSITEQGSSAIILKVVIIVFLESFPNFLKYSLQSPFDSANNILDFFIICIFTSPS